jgi:hypothetical protein
VVGVRGNQVPVPARLLDSGAEPEGRAGTESEGWQLPLSPAQFEAAPRIDQESDQNLENPAFRLRVDEYYRQFAGRDARRGAVAPQ